MATELELRPQHQDGMDLIRAALQSDGTPSEKAALVKELVSLQQSMERFTWEREQRQEEQDFGDALTECQRQIGRIAPNVHRENNIWWADYVQLDRTVRPIYLTAGFAISFSDAETDDQGRVRIRATLKRGRIEREYFKEISRAPASSKMSQPDADASACSRAKRYLLLDIFNIAIGIDKDEKDGIPDNAEAMDPATFKQLSEDMEMMANKDDLRDSYYKAMEACGVTTEDLGRADWQKKAKYRREANAFVELKNKLLGELGRRK
jgi:hypothetical protein